MEGLSEFTGIRTFHTSESQKEIWLSCVIGGDDANRAYNESISIELKGYLDFTSLKKAIFEVQERHDILKSTFSSDGQSINIVGLNRQIEVVQLFGLDHEIQIEMVNEILEKQALLLFNLESGPLTHITLVKKSPEENVLIFTAHHLICDGWSTGVFLRELSRLYNFYYQGYGIPLEAAPSYWEFADFEKNFHQSSQYSKNIEFWKKELGTNPNTLKLVTDFERSESRSFNGRRLDQTIDIHVAEKLKGLAKELGVSFFNLLLSAFELLMAKSANQSNFIIGLPAAGQVAAEQFNLIGHCVNLLPVPVSVDLSLSFSDYVKKRKNKLSDILDHQQITFGTLIKELRIARKANEIPLVPVVFNVDLGMDDEISFLGLDFHIHTNPRKFENFEIFLNLFESKSSFILEWSYNPDLFTASSIQSWSDEFQLILAAILEDSSQTLHDLLRFPKQQSSIETPITNDQLKGFTSVVHLIEESVELHADKVAVIFKDRPLTYQKLNSLSNRLARMLHINGVKKGDKVGLIMERSEKMIVSILAILKAGAAYLPIDTDYPISRISFTLEDAGAKLALIDKKNSEKFKHHFEAIDYEEAIFQAEHKEDSNLMIDFEENDPAYIIYTSGSTGQPKGVILDHGNLYSFLMNVSEKPGIDSSDVLLAVTSNSFDISIMELLLPYVHGAQSFLLDNFERRDPKKILEVIQKNNITTMFATPSHWKMMLDTGWSNRFSKLNIISGGEALEVHLADRLVDRCKALWNIYGPTETTVFSTIKQIETKGIPISIGKPIRGTNIYILDENGNPLTTGQTGEMYISGQGVGQGYINRPALNKEKFLVDPFVENASLRMFRTGDLGRYDSKGELFCHGRIDQQVKFRGFRIELDEISSKLVARDEVADAIVDVKEVNGEKSLVAYMISQKHDPKFAFDSWKEKWDNVYEEGQKEIDLQADQNGDLDYIIASVIGNEKDFELEASEWKAQSIKRLNEIGAKKILEVGSGAGQIAFELIDGAEHYIATDFATTAIDNLRKKIAKMPHLGNRLEAKVSAADDFSFVPNNSLDLVIIHSVAQYFPSSAYLLTTIKNSIDALTDGGCLFIGDMQGAATLGMYHAFDQLRNVKSRVSLKDFREIVDRRVAIEDELTADPQFFYELIKSIPQITAVDIQYREGSVLNETTKYHYDVWIFKGGPKSNVNTEVSHKWNQGVDADNLVAILQGAAQKVVRIENVPNARTAEDFDFFQFIQSSDGNLSIQEYRQNGRAISQGVNPDWFRILGEQNGFKTFVRPQSDGLDNLLDVYFVPKTQVHKDSLPAIIAVNESASLSSLAREPFCQHVQLNTAEIKKHLEGSLPSFMVPSYFVELSNFPLSQNGKVQKQLLPIPEIGMTVKHTSDNIAYQLSQEEQVIAEIWSKALGMSHVGPHDDFFELGGHSLLAVKVMSQIDAKFGIRVPISTLFHYPTIASLANKLFDQHTSKEWSCIVPIKTTGSKKPLFIVHGAGLNVMPFHSLANVIESDQPIYGIQAKGLNGTDKPFDCIKEMAEYYVVQLLDAQPKANIELAGYSFGGVIAFEMARILREKHGILLDKVIMIEAYADQANFYKDGVDRFLTKSRIFFEKRYFNFKILLKSPKIYKEEKIHYYVQNLKNLANAIFGTKNESDQEDSLMKTIRAIEGFHALARNNYSIQPLDVKVALLKTKNQYHWLQDFQSYGWKDYAREVVCEEIQGNHNMIFEPENIQILAEGLEKIIRK
ncbi:amino acid adenylation domain-containing protein [Belliella sp. DSM 107340]|uniref:Amino acid adenylation domain-containing protein n=1 Tax=Belliella calami TaxID=2923436 RepID=A0ABS9UU29_9BACT|nr:non-ribosomal peptide synthetase [Belliella calami]MCH7400137.1 amino acid adenylation domain-containing protein [Belliella calami]